MIEEFALSYGAGKAVDVLANKFKDNVLARWRRHRAEQFFRSFTSEVEHEWENGDQSEELTSMLARLTEEEEASAALFDAYRRVALSASRTLGPRVIGLLTARLVLENRTAQSHEERIFMAAENMNDSEMLDMMDFLQYGRLTAEEIAEGFNRSSLSIEADAQVYDKNSPGRQDISPLDLEANLGMWAIKLRNVGLLKEEVTQAEREYDVDTERHVDEPGVEVQTTWNAVLHPAVSTLIILIGRAIDASDSAV